MEVARSTDETVAYRLLGADGVVAWCEPRHGFEDEYGDRLFAPVPIGGASAVAVRKRAPPRGGAVQPSLVDVVLGGAGDVAGHAGNGECDLAAFGHVDQSFA